MTTAAANIVQARSPYYAFIDWYRATSGDYHYLDTNGEPYILEGMGITAGSVAWTSVITLTVFLTVSVVGLSLGLSGRQRGVPVLALGAGVVVTLVILFTVGVRLGNSLPEHAPSTPVRLDHLPRFLMTLAACASTPPSPPAG